MFHFFRKILNNMIKRVTTHEPTEVWIELINPNNNIYAFNIESNIYKAHILTATGEAGFVSMHNSMSMESTAPSFMAAIESAINNGRDVKQFDTVYEFLDWAKNLVPTT